MAYSSSAVSTRDLAFPQPQLRANASERVKRGIFARVLESMLLARRRQAERDIARFLSDSGGKFTDETEREIERRFLSAPSHW
jgi:hypothetical protein